MEPIYLQDQEKIDQTLIACEDMKDKLDSLKTIFELDILDENDFDKNDIAEKIEDLQMILRYQLSAIYKEKKYRQGLRNEDENDLIEPENSQQ